LTKTNQKTKECPHCEARINTERARVVGSATTAREASELVRALKQKKGKMGSDADGDNAFKY